MSEPRTPYGKRKRNAAQDAAHKLMLEASRQAFDITHDVYMSRREQIDKASVNWWMNIAHQCGDAEEAFMAGAQWADEHPHWISVEEELPKENEPVLAFVRTTEYEFPFVGIYSSGTWYYTEPIIKDESNVTHWMPLPPAPNFEQQPD